VCFGRAAPCTCRININVNVNVNVKSGLSVGWRGGVGLRGRRKYVLVATVLLEERQPFR